MVIVSKQVFADVVYIFWPIGWIDATGVTDGVGVPVGVVVIVVVGVMQLVFVSLVWKGLNNANLHMVQSVSSNDSQRVIARRLWT